MGGDGSRMPKFFVDDSCITGNIVEITGQDYKHIKNVLRLKLGNNIIISDKEGKDFEARIIGFQDGKVEAEILQSIGKNKEPSVNISLFQALPKGEKMEYVIQKAVEIGVKKIIPVLTERVVVKLDEKSSIKKTERWNKISEQAAKQSGRNIIPEVVKPVNFNNTVKILESYNETLILYENEENVTLKEALNHIDNKTRSIAIFIGPEGGFSREEIEALKCFRVVSLGSRILRTETAGLVTAAIILYQMGDLG